MIGQFADLGFLPSYYLAEITAVNTELHTASIQLLRGLMIYENVKIFTDFGSFCLPTVGDICITLWDNRNTPIIFGYYPVRHKDKLDTNRYYNVQEGERMLQSEFGQKLLFNNAGEIYLTNWKGQGLEIYQNNGLMTYRSDTIDIDSAGVKKRIGYTKRYSPLARKDSTITSSDGLLMASTLGVGVKTLVEDATILSEPGAPYTTLYSHKVGNLVVAEDPTLPTSEIKTVPTITTSALRSQTRYFSSDGLSYLEVSIDTLGNVKIDIPATAVASGVNIAGLASKFAMDFLNIDIGSSTTVTNNIKAVTINVTGGTAVKVEAPLVTIGSTATQVKLGATAGALCDNLPFCMFTGASHTTTNTTVFV